MAVTLAGTRPKSTTTNAITPALTAGSAVETDSGSEESHFIPFNLGATDPASFTVASVTTTNGSATVTVTGDAFSSVKVGDAVSGTNIPGGTTVSTKTNNNTLVLSSTATGSGSVTLTVDPPSGTPPVYGFRVVYSLGGSVLSLKPYLYTYDGSLAPGVAGTAANATQTIELVAKDGKAIAVDLDAFLTNYRVSRSA